MKYKFIVKRRYVAAFSAIYGSSKTQAYAATWFFTNENDKRTTKTNTHETKDRQLV